jgi:hypothetical protein
MPSINNNNSKNSTHLDESKNLFLGLSGRFGWLYFLITILILSLTTVSILGYKNISSNTNIITKEPELTYIQPNIEIEALVGEKSSKNTVTRIIKPLFTSPLFTNDTKDVKIYDNQDSFVIPWLYLNENLTLEETKTSQNWEKSKTLKSVIISEAYLEKMDFENIPSIVEEITTGINSNYPGVNIQISSNSLNNKDKSKNNLIQLLSELKTILITKNLKLTLTSNASLTEDSSYESIESIPSKIFLLCEEDKECNTINSEKIVVIKNYKTLNNTKNTNENRIGVMSESYIATLSDKNLNLN